MKYYIYFLFITYSGISFAQRTLSGTVRETASGEGIVGAMLYDTLHHAGAYTNAAGFFSLTVPAGPVCIRVSGGSYAPLWLKLPSGKDTTLAVMLAPASTEVVGISDSAAFALPRQGVMQISVAQLNKIPALMGERDMLRALSLLPGVATGMEGSSGLLVRGGSPDQNLILLDDAPLYNPTHLFGFLSTINPDAVKHVDLYKGAFPARFGGRLSSVIDITTRDGDASHPVRKAEIGLLSSKISLEGPLGSTSTTCTFSARAFYLGLLTLPGYLSARNGSGDGFSYNMGDLNFHLTHRLRKGGRLSGSAYASSDYLFTASGSNSGAVKSSAGSHLGWSNQSLSVRYDKAVTPKVFVKAVAVFSAYSYSLGQSGTDIYPDGDSSITLSSSYQTKARVRDGTFRFQTEWYHSPLHTLRAGADIGFQRFRPSNYRTRLTDGTQYAGGDRIAAWQTSAFADNDFHLTEYLRVQAGIRVAQFSVEDTVYPALEPRLAVDWRMGKFGTLQASLSYMNQFVQLLSTSNSGLPNDIWVPATRQVSPQRGYLYAAGWAGKVTKDITWSVEGYYRHMKGLIDYRQGIDFSGGVSRNWRDLIATGGTGEVYGVEALIHKPAGKWNGWAGYTLAWNKRQLPEVNNAQWYYSRYDRRHILTLTGSWAFSKQWSVAGTFVYMSGSPVSLPAGMYLNQANYPVYLFPGRNNARLPAYHRLDLGFTRTWLRENGKERSLSVGCYNAYNRVNPIFITVKQHADGSTYAAGQGLFPFLPYFSYQWHF